MGHLTRGLLWEQGDEEYCHSYVDLLTLKKNKSNKIYGPILRSLCHHKGSEALGQDQGSTGMWGRTALLDPFLKIEVDLQCVHFWCTAK